MKQVSPDHYRFEEYESPERFTNYYYQVLAALRLQPETVLEIGTGTGAFAALLERQGIRTITLDLDPELRPAVAGSVLQLPARDHAVDVSAAFQILEHLPFEQFGVAIAELARVARIGVIMSLPEFGNAGLVASLPFVRKLRFAGRGLPGYFPTHKFDGQHYWEINKRGYSLQRIRRVMEGQGLTLVDCWLNPYNPYHRFFMLTVRTDAVSR